MINLSLIFLSLSLSLSLSLLFTRSGLVRVVAVVMEVVEEEVMMTVTKETLRVMDERNNLKVLSMLINLISNPFRHEIVTPLIGATVDMILGRCGFWILFG